MTTRTFPSSPAFGSAAQQGRKSLLSQLFAVTPLAIFLAALSAKR